MLPPTDDALPLTPALAARLERLLGAPLLSAERVRGGGYTPTLRLRCVTRRGSAFVKVATTPLTAGWVREESAKYRLLGERLGGAMPAYLGWEDDPEAPMLAIEDLSAHHWPPPWEPRHIALAVAQVRAMHRAGGEGLPTFAAAHGAWGDDWRTVADDPAPLLALGVVDAAWLEASLPALMSAATACPTEGVALCHLDIRSDNLCLAPERAILVDWNWACRANPDLDLGFWLPSLAAEGGPPPEEILPHAPEVAACVAGFFAARAGLPEIPDAPRVRWVQRQQLIPALGWAARALGLPQVAR
jgi:hypothetical protein